MIDKTSTTNVQLIVERCLCETDVQTVSEKFVVEEVIERQTSNPTGYRGNPYYAAELGLTPATAADDNAPVVIPGILMYFSFHHHRRRRRRRCR